MFEQTSHLDFTFGDKIVRDTPGQSNRFVDIQLVQRLLVFNPLQEPQLILAVNLFSKNDLAIVSLPGRSGVITILQRPQKMTYNV